MIQDSASVLGLVALAVLVGGMIFFAAIMEPAIFTKLEPAVAGRFIRQVFPRYYAFMIITAAVSAVGFGVVDPWLGLVMAVIAVATVWLRQGLMPAINRCRDAELAGDISAGSRFKMLHQLSVVVNITQLIAAIGVLTRVALH